MPNVPLVDMAGDAQGEKSLSEGVFGVTPNRHLLYEAVKHYRAKLHRGTHATKSRGLVRGGGHKPWRQKGTGRARVGSIRTPLWTKGGTVFGPQPRDYGFKLNGKVQRGALRSALSLRVKEGAVTIAPSLAWDAPSTKSLRQKLEGLGVGSDRVLLVDLKPSEGLYLSARNLRRVQVRSSSSVHAYDVLAARKLIISEEALLNLEERLQR